MNRVLRRIIRRWEARTCREAVDLMTDYLEGAMDERQQQTFERHLARCTACTAYLGQMRATVDALGHLPVETLPDDVRQGLVGLFRTMRSG